VVDDDAAMRRAVLIGTAAALALLAAGPLGASGTKAVHAARSVWNGDIYVVNADGTERVRLTRDPAEEFSPAWSPDGTKIAFSRFTGSRFQIFVMSAEGTGAQQLTFGDSAALGAAWSPDGTRIAFTRCAVSCDVYVMDADGRGLRRLTYGEQPGDVSPTWSPDGHAIAFADIDGLFAIGAFGGPWHRLTEGPADDADPSWSPDGTQIAFDGSRGLFNGDIYVVGAKGAGMRQVTDSAPLDSHPAWSPDGASIAFMRKARKVVQARLWVMNANGTGQTNLGAIGDAYSTPAWSPDGQRIAYSWLTACIVPPVAGKALGDARARIRRASCAVGPLRYARSSRPGGTVLAQRPQARAERKIGSRVRLVVSRG
jgi:Tol biopolymer transport system component